MKKSFSRKIKLAVILLAIMAAQPAHAFKMRHAQMRDLNITQWLPDNFGTDGEKYPLIVFSHGFGGCATQSSFLMEALADFGYAVIAPNHADARCAGQGESAAKTGGRLAGLLQKGMDSQEGRSLVGLPEQPFAKPEDWRATTEFDRTVDVELALDQALKDSETKNYIDPERVGLAGHSLGGYTVLGLAGAWPAWRNNQYKAVLAMAPYSAPYVIRYAISNVRIPVMFQGGSRDQSMTKDIAKPRGAYEQAAGPKYFVNFEGAGHFGFTNAKDANHDLMSAYTIDFFNKYLKEEDPKILDKPALAGVAEYRADP